jgi:hypothetical protein
MYGLVNAVTRTAEDSGENYDRCIELERLASDVLEMDREIFSEN